MEIFKGNGDISKNAYLNWNTNLNDTSHNLYMLANDFKNASIVMMNVVLEDNVDKKADSLIMPILFCINQSIEIYLKAVIFLANQLDNKNEKITTSHDIKSLYNTLKGKIEKKGKTKGLEKHFSVMNAYINELYSYIKKPTDNKPKMDFARYPVDTDGKAHFYIESEDNVIVNVKALYDNFNKISASLECIYNLYMEERRNQ